MRFTRGGGDIAYIFRGGKFLGLHLHVTSLRNVRVVVVNILESPNVARCFMVLEFCEVQHVSTEVQTAYYWIHPD